jgi:hypothetical protein
MPHPLEVSAVCRFYFRRFIIEVVVFKDVGMFDFFNSRVIIFASCPTYVIQDHTAMYTRC